MENLAHSGTKWYASRQWIPKLNLNPLHFLHIVQGEKQTKIPIRIVERVDKTQENKVHSAGSSQPLKGLGSHAVPIKFSCGKQQFNKQNREDEQNQTVFF